MIDLETFFQSQVAAGWSPSNPATAADLAPLSPSMVHGTCIEPIVVAGDIVYIDPNTPPQPGDLVSFTLSHRGAEAQNSGLPAGQLPALHGDRWMKMYAVSHGFEMLLDKYGSSATATLMACESPDDTPALATVRNIRRGGKLLYGPDAGHPGLIPRRGVLAATVAGLALAGCDFGGVPIETLPSVSEPDNSSSSQLGSNAATVVFTLLVAGPDTYNAGTLPTAPTYYGQISGLTNGAQTVIATLTCDIVQTVSGSIAEVYVEAAWSGGTQDSDICEVNLVGIGSRYTVQKSFTAIPSGAAFTVTIRLSCSGSASFTITNTTLQLELILK